MGMVSLASSSQVCRCQDLNSPSDETPTWPQQLGLLASPTGSLPWPEKQTIAMPLSKSPQALKALLAAL